MFEPLGIPDELAAVDRLLQDANLSLTAKNPPSMLGPLFKNCKEVLWPRLPNAPWPTDFIDVDAKLVRNAAAHDSISFDPSSCELIVVDNKTQLRLGEHELRRRLAEMVMRARTMHYALLKATGLLESSVTALGADDEG